MAAPGSTWLQLLQSIWNEFQRLDLATGAPTLNATNPPLSTDPVWVYAVEAIEYYAPRIFPDNQATNQWTSTIVSNNPGSGWVGNLYSLPPDWEDDLQILINISGQNTPMTKISIVQMNEYDVQGPPVQSPVIGPPAYYCIWAQMLRLFPWPDMVYPMTAVYNSLIATPTSVTTSNFWTTSAEPLIRHAAVGLIKEHFTKEPDFQGDYDAATLQFNKLSGRVRQQSGVGRARPCYL
jgi:hypothetical protein